MFQSAALPDKTILGVVPSGLATSVDAPRIETSGETELHMETGPQEIVDIGGVFAVP